MGGLSGWVCYMSGWAIWVGGLSGWVCYMSGWDIWVGGLSGWGVNGKNSNKFFFIPEMHFGKTQNIILGGPNLFCYIQSTDWPLLWQPPSLLNVMVIIKY